MAGGIAKVAGVKGGAQPVDYNPVLEAQKILEQLKSSGLSSTFDVPGVADPTGTQQIPAERSSFRVPARLDPDLVASAQQELARANALQGAAGFVPATVFGVKHGRAAGPMPGGGGPVWDAVRSQITAPVQRAQADVDQTNQANDMLNRVLTMNTQATSQDRASAMQMASTLGAAKVAAADRATQAKQFEQSQATTREGHLLSYYAALAKMNGPQAEKLHQLRALNASALTGLDDLEDKIRSGTASPMSATIMGRRVGTDAGTDTANTVGQLANNLSQVGERRGLRGPMQDEIAHELNSGIATPAAGLRAIAKWRKYVMDFNDEIGKGMHLGTPPGAPGAAPGGDFDPTQPIGGQ